MKIGVLGGTFDPIHYGHLIIGEQAREELGLDEMIFIPTGNPAHKEESNVSDAEIRYEMLKLAIKGNKDFRKSSIEIDRRGKSYTIDTIKQLKRQYNRDQIYFLIGEDSLFQLETWHKFMELKEECNFVVCRRYIRNENKIRNKIKYMEDKYNMDIYLLDTPIIEISSTKIRNLFSQGKSIKYLLPEEVENYISENNIYGVDKD